MTVRDFSWTATCYPETNGRVRPEADVRGCSKRTKRINELACKESENQITAQGITNRRSTRLPMLPISRIGELLPHRVYRPTILWPSWEGQVQTKHPAEDEGEEPQPQER